MLSRCCAKVPTSIVLEYGTVFFGVIRFFAKKVRHLRLDGARSLR